MITTPLPQLPNPYPAQVDWPWTRKTWDEYQEIIRRLQALDEKLGLRDCEDPAKGEWMRQVEERLNKLEGGFDK